MKWSIFVQMKISKYVDVNKSNYAITFKIMKKYLEIYWKPGKKSVKSHGILTVRKSGNPAGIKMNFSVKCRLEFFSQIDFCDQNEFFWRNIFSFCKHLWKL